MRLIPLSLLSLLCLLPRANAEDNSIYHDGWIDLNKNGREDAYEDATNSPETRINDLLSQMTLAEKIGQMYQALRDPETMGKYAGQLRQGGVGSFLDAGQMLDDATQRNALQRLAVEQSRLGIPLIFGHDSIHGFRTVFPIPLGLACAWDANLFERAEAISARESAAVGVDWTFAPMVDLARDPRWGRIAEGFGEDPWLGSVYAAACVRGFQGTNIAAPNRLAACLKHYVGYGATEGGRDYNTAEISEYTLRNFYLPPFKAGVDAGAWTLMSGFNLLSGMPASGNRHTLTEILRDEWKFPGFVVSDWESVREMLAHGVPADDAAAARLALTAGVDMEMVSDLYRTTLPAQVTAGKVPVAVVDEAVRRILRVKIAKGLLDRPYTDEALAKPAFLRADALAIAREAAAKSCVLLRNEHGTLPLAAKVNRVALIGPLADEPAEMLGAWAAPGKGSEVVSLAAGLRARLSADAPVTIVRGCGLPGLKTTKRTDGTVQVDLSAGADEIERAVAAAREADVVILALGEPASWSGENAARSDLILPGKQMDLFNAVAATGKSVIVVLFNGRPLAIPELAGKAAAILEAWQPGVQAGNGVADVLFGDVAPAGRLTTSFPRSVGQVPVYYNHYNTGRPGLGEYVDGPRTPLYPFGYGLTYTTFAYDRVQLNATTVRPGEPLTAKIKLSNTGTRPGEEVVQLYLRDVASSAGPRPVRELKGFAKVQLNPGESRDVSFTLSDRELGSYDAQGHWRVEPGHFQLWISPDATHGEPAEFELRAAEK